MNLSNKVVVLTGASQGIGRAAAYKFVASGSKVVLVARSEDLLNRIAAELGEDHALVIPADISQQETHSRIVAETMRRFGRIDILVNNAGVGIYDPCESVAPSDVQIVMDVNFFGALYLTQACIAKMRAGGGGLIINISSIAGKRGVPNMGPYCASKAALERFTESWRMELATDNIRFSTLYPGTTQTNFKRNALGSHQQKSSPTERMPAEQVAQHLIRVAEREPRDAYVRLFDRAFVFVSGLFPRAFDNLLGRYYKT